MVGVDWRRMFVRSWRHFVGGQPSRAEEQEAVTRGAVVKGKSRGGAIAVAWMVARHPVVADGRVRPGATWLSAYIHDVHPALDRMTLEYAIERGEALYRRSQRSAAKIAWMVMSRQSLPGGERHYAE